MQRFRACFLGFGVESRSSLRFPVPVRHSARGSSGDPLRLRAVADSILGLEVEMTVGFIASHFARTSRRWLYYLELTGLHVMLKIRNASLLPSLSTKKSHSEAGNHLEYVQHLGFSYLSAD